MKPNDRLKQHREDINLSIETVAQAANLTVCQYEDIESYESELYDVIQLGEIRQICSILKLDMVCLFEFAPCSIPSDSRSTTWLHAKRTEKRLSIPRVSDFIGIEEEFIVEAERDVSTLDNWVFDALISYAKILDVSPACFI